MAGQLLFEFADIQRCPVCYNDMVRVTIALTAISNCDFYNCRICYYASKPIVDGTE